MNKGIFNLTNNEKILCFSVIEYIIKFVGINVLSQSCLNIYYSKDKLLDDFKKLK